LSRADQASAPNALQIYETLRRERTAGVQRISRVNGARYDSATGDLNVRDRQLAAQPQERAWIWNYDAEAEALAAAALL
jgi:salicylate hydroxylase